MSLAESPDFNSQPIGEFAVPDTLEALLSAECLIDSAAQESRRHAAAFDDLRQHIRLVGAMGTNDILRQSYHWLPVVDGEWSLLIHDEYNTRYEEAFPFTVVIINHLASDVTTSWEYVLSNRHDIVTQNCSLIETSKLDSPSTMLDDAGPVLVRRGELLYVNRGKNNQRAWPDFQRDPETSELVEQRIFAEVLTSALAGISTVSHEEYVRLAQK